MFEVWQRFDPHNIKFNRYGLICLSKRNFKIFDCSVPKELYAMAVSSCDFKEYFPLWISTLWRFREVEEIQYPVLELCV